MVHMAVLHEQADHLLAKRSWEEVRNRRSFQHAAALWQQHANSVSLL